MYAVPLEFVILIRVLRCRIIPHPVFIRLAPKINVAILDVYVFKFRINISNLMSITCKFGRHACIQKAAQTTEQMAMLGMMIFCSHNQAP